MSQPLREYPPLRVEGVSFGPVIELPGEYEIFDFTTGYDPGRPLESTYGIGRYDERRPGMYVGDQFTDSAREVHVGIDIAAPVLGDLY